MNILQNICETLQTHHQSELPTEYERNEQWGTYSICIFLLYLSVSLVSHPIKRRWVITVEKKESRVENFTR